VTVVTGNEPTIDTSRVILITGGVVSAVIIIAVAVAERLTSIAPFAAALPIVGVVAFAGVYYDTRRVRHGLATGLFALYAAVLGFFLNPQLLDAIREDEFVEQLFSSLTALVGAVAAFYFSADAAERIATRRTPEALDVTDTAPRESSGGPVDASTG
jgi:FtsH-binding integral membrane protein